MKVFGLVLFVLGAGILFFSAVVGTNSIASLSGTLVGVGLLIPGSIFSASGVALEYLIKSRSAALSAQLSRVIPEYSGEADIACNPYRIFLVKHFEIHRSDILDGIICGDQMFDDVERALAHADRLYRDRVMKSGTIGLNRYVYEVRPERTTIQTGTGALVEFDSISAARTFFAGQFSSKKEAAAIEALIRSQATPVKDPWKQRGKNPDA